MLQPTKQPGQDEKKLFLSKKNTEFREQVIQHRRAEGVPQDDGKGRFQDNYYIAAPRKPPGQTPGEKSSRRDYYWTVLVC